MNNREDEALTPEELGEIEEMAAIGKTIVEAAREGTPCIALPERTEGKGYVILLLLDAPPSVLAALETIVDSARITLPLSGTEEEIEARLEGAMYSPTVPDSTWTRVVKRKK
mgnify:CR=1 FL=1|jgi:hypothetical protein